MPSTRSPVVRDPNDRPAARRGVRRGAVLAAVLLAPVLLAPVLLAGAAGCARVTVAGPGSGIPVTATGPATTGTAITGATEIAGPRSGPATWSSTPAGPSGPVAPPSATSARPAPSGGPAASPPASGSAGSGGVGADGPAASTPVRRWLAAPVVEIAHHGGSADWPPSSPEAYRRARDWNPALALEFSARRTADGVWVGSEEATTGPVYGTDLTIATSTWDQLSGLRSVTGGQPMSRLDADLLEQVPADRVLFVDDKDNAHVDDLLDLLDRYGGAGRTVIKSYWQSETTPTQAHRRGYLTWGYYYGDQMDRFPSSQSRFDLLGINVDAPPQVYAQMLATGKCVIAHVIATPAQADTALARGATGLMVSGVQEVVPRS